MPYYPDQHHRHSIRLRGYNYAQPGMYFVTICLQHREHLFGAITDRGMALSAAGQMIQSALIEIPQPFPYITIDTYVVIPDHVHVIVQIASPTEGITRKLVRLGDVIGGFKSLTTPAYIRGVHQRGWPAFAQRLWQRNYFERVVRTERELHTTRTYIVNNPQRWLHRHTHA
jgi:putative transposase